MYAKPLCLGLVTYQKSAFTTCSGVCCVCIPDMDSHEQAAPSRLQWVLEAQLRHQDSVLPQPVIPAPTTSVEWAVHDCSCAVSEATVLPAWARRHL